MANATNIVRVATDLARPNRAPVNEIDGLQIRINRGKPYCFELGIFDKDVWQESVSQFTGITIQIRPNPGGAAVVDVNAAMFAGNVAVSAWEGRTGQHAQVQITGAQTAALSAPSPWTATYWISIFATSVATGEPVTLAAGYMAAIEDGSNLSASTPISGDPAYMTAAQTTSAIQAAVDSPEIKSNGGKYIVIPSVDEADGLVTWAARLA